MFNYNPHTLTTMEEHNTTTVENIVPTYKILVLFRSYCNKENII